MTSIRLVQIGPAVTTALSNLAITLERIQDEYRFDLDTDTIVPDLAHMVDGRYPESYLDEIIAHYKNRKRSEYYVIAVADFPLPDEIFAMNDERVAVLTTYNWNSISSHPLEKGLEYLVASILPDVHRLITHVHAETRGCPNDFCDDLQDINRGIESGEFCDTCRRRLFSAIDKGDIGGAQVTAIYKILDHVSNRKLCFVLMPFEKKSDRIYDSVKYVMIKYGFTCVRSDEIFQTRTVMAIVNEMISRAELIVADLTGRNPNVFYELGYAHALNKNSILLAQRSTDVPFDLRHRQHVTYRPTKDLRTALERKLRKYLTQ